MKFTHRLFKTKGWGETILAPSDCEEVKHLGECPFDGDMFVAYSNQGEIHIFKGTMEEETFKTNTWYRHRKGGFFVYRTGDENNYIIGIYGDEYFNHPCLYFNLWTEATDEEIEEALIKLAKKKGFENIDKLTLKDFYGEIYHKGMFECLGNHYIYNDGKLFLDGVIIFKHGEWVEILEKEINLEERLKRIEEKLNI